MGRRTVLVTGSSGKLGSDLVKSLGRDHDLVQLDVREPEDPGQRSIGRVCVGSVTDAAVLTEALEGVDTIIHAAGIPGEIPDLHRLLDTNVLGTAMLLEAAGRSPTVVQFIFISSICWHGVGERPIERHRPARLPFDETQPSLATRYYACSKAQAEYWCQKYVERFGKPCVAVRPAWIVPLDKQPAFRSVDSTKGNHLFDYIGTSDLIDGIVRAMEYHPANGFDRFLFHATDKHSAVPSLDLAERIFPGVPVDREKLSTADGFGAFVDCSYAREKLGWAPRYRCKR